VTTNLDAKSATNPPKFLDRVIAVVDRLPDATLATNRPKVLERVIAIVDTNNAVNN